MFQLLDGRSHTADLGLGVPRLQPGSSLLGSPSQLVFQPGPGSTLPLTVATTPPPSENPDHSIGSITL